MRGFQDNTLGPRDSNGDPLGGSTKLLGSMELFFPVPFLEDLNSVRIGAFADAGMVSDGFNFSDDMRYSVGVSGQWLSPFGALTVSAAIPLNEQDGDRVQMFQFSFGQGF